MTQTAKTIRIGITGCRGRMGAALVQELQSSRWQGLSLAGGTVKKGESTDAPFFVTTSAAKLLGESDLLIDFTTPEAAIFHAGLAAKSQKPILIGTTGLTDAQEAEIAKAGKKCPVLYAANTSIGINILTFLVERVAEKLGPDWDIEIAETHHRHKKDAPSGTALSLGRAAAAGRGRTLNEKEIHDRSGERPAGSIGFAVQRGGDVVGEHMVTFFGAGERLQLGHISTDRALYARGALHGAQWLAEQSPGLYTMQDALGF